MNFKILVKLIVPEIQEEYELYIPINKTVGYCTKLFMKMITERYNVFPEETKANLYNRRTGEYYKSSLLIRNTNIRNGTELILLTI